MSAALLDRAGIYGEMLKVAEHVENIEQPGSNLLPALANLRLTQEELRDMQLTAYAWSEQVSRQA